MKKKLIIKDRNKTIYFKNRKVRTPCTLNVTDKEIEQIRLTLKMAGVEQYSVEISNKVELHMSEDLFKKEVIIEELDFEDESEDEGKTILEKLMNGESE